MANAFTGHAEESGIDYFSVVDDHHAYDPYPNAAHIGDMFTHSRPLPCRLGGNTSEALPDLFVVFVEVCEAQKSLSFSTELLLPLKWTPCHLAI